MSTYGKWQIGGRIYEGRVVQCSVCKCLAGLPWEISDGDAEAEACGKGYRALNGKWCCTKRECRIAVGFCPDCNGLGQYVGSYTYHDEHGFLHEEPEQRQCERCNMTGKLPAPEATCAQQ